MFLTIIRTAHRRRHSKSRERDYKERGHGMISSFFSTAVVHTISSQIEKILRSQTGPTNLFRFIVNPADFGQTVENMFYLSFLIREGKCAFEFTEDTQEPIICKMFLC